MNIGIDLDNVLSDTVKTFIKYHNKVYNTNNKFEECIDSEGNVFNINKDEFLSRFHDFIRTKSNLLKTIKYSKDILEELSKENNLFVITSRDQKLENVTVNWLNKNFGNIFNKIILTKYNFANGKYIKEKNKLEICKINKIDIMIEDSLLLSMLCSKEIPVLLLDINYRWNKKENLPKSIKRVHSWKEIKKEIEKINFNSIQHQ